MALTPGSANQSLPACPSAMSFTNVPLLGSGYSTMAPIVEILATTSPAPCVNQRFPSAPAVMSASVA
jgi:hypothetical protein